MTRGATLPTGVSTVAIAAQYRARHAVAIGTPTPIRLCQGPGSLVIGGDTYTEDVLDPGSFTVGGLPGGSLRVSNADNLVSEADAAGTLLGVTLVVYEVHWSAAGAQLDPVMLFSGIVTAVKYGSDGATLTGKLRLAISAGMVGRIVSRLCSHVFKGTRCSFLGAYTAVLTRATTAYKQDGTSVASGLPRYEAAKYSNGITVEEGTTNLLSANQSGVETDTTGFAVIGGATIARDTGQKYEGAASLKVTCAALGNGAYTSTMPAATVGLPYAVRARIKGENTKLVRLYVGFYTSGTVFISGSYVELTCDATWQTVNVAMVAPATTAKVALLAYNWTSGAHTFYLDCLQIEQKAYATSWHIGAGTRNAETLTIPQAAVSNAVGTFEAWIKLLRAPGTNQQYILDANGATNYGLKFYVRTDGKLECVFGTGSSEVTITGTNALIVDTLYHVAVTWAAAGVTIYRNGSSEGTSGTAPGLAAGTLVYLGSKADGTLQLDGFIDDLRIEDNARSGTDIAADYASATALSLTAHTLGKYAFDSSLAGTGNILTCDRTMVTCIAYGNILRYGGWPSMPQIGQKFSYTVTTPQPATSEVAGTYVPPAAPYNPFAEFYVAPGGGPPKRLKRAD